MEEAQEEEAWFPLLESPGSPDGASPVVDIDPLELQIPDVLRNIFS